LQDSCFLSSNEQGTLCGLHMCRTVGGDCLYLSWGRQPSWRLQRQRPLLWASLHGLLCHNSVSPLSELGKWCQWSQKAFAT
jgi:hypothetical protein